MNHARDGEKGRKRERLHRWMKARLWPARTRSRELWVSHIFADVRTTKSFSLAALFSTRKSCSVTALVRTKQPRLLRAEQKDALSFLSFSLKVLYRFRYRASRREHVCARFMRGIHEYSPYKLLTQRQWGIKILLLELIPPTYILISFNCNSLFHQSLFFFSRKRKTIELVFSLALVSS